MNFFHKLLTVTLSCLLLTAVQADVYRWTDENGKTVYSDTPPAQLNDVQRISVDDRANDPPANNKNEIRELTRRLDKMAAQRKEKEARLERERKERERREQRCAKAREQKHDLENLPGYATYWKTKKGYEMLTPEVRDSQLEIVNKVIQENCE